MRIPFTLLFLFAFFSLQAQNVNIPDVNFKTILLASNNINTNGDNEIQVSEAVAFTGQLACGGQNISDLTGLEAFTEIQALRCENNNLTTLDVSANTKLFDLRCGQNQLTSLDVSQNPLLIGLRCELNAITSLDLSNHPDLLFLYVEGNQLSSLDLTLNTKIEQLHCQENQLSTLTMGPKADLNVALFHDNNLSTVDLSTCSQAFQIWAHKNNFSSLDLSNASALRLFRCDENQLTTLDLSNNSDLEDLTCNDNQLTALDVSNGNNTNVVFLRADNNPDLNCIQVDDAAYSNANWTMGNFIFDPGASFSANCSVGLDDAVNSTLTLFPNPTQGSLSVRSSVPLQSVLVYNTSGQLVLKSLASELSLEHLPQGLYSVEVRTADQATYHTIVKK